MASRGCKGVSGVLVCNKASPVGEFKADLGSHDQSDVIGPPLPSAFPPRAGETLTLALSRRAGEGTLVDVPLTVSSKIRGSFRADGGRSLNV